MTTPNDSGVTPLEAAAREIAEAADMCSPDSECFQSHPYCGCRTLARAALSAAIEALPDLLEIDSFQDRHGRNVHTVSDVTHVFVSRIKVGRGPWLRRAFGLEEET